MWWSKQIPRTPGPIEKKGLAVEGDRLLTHGMRIANVAKHLTGRLGRRRSTKIQWVHWWRIHTVQVCAGCSQNYPWSAQPFETLGFLQKSWGHLAVPCESSLVKSSVVVGSSSYVSQSYPYVDWSCSQVCLVSVSKPSFFDVISIVSTQSPVLELKNLTHCLRASPPFFGVPQNPKVWCSQGSPEVLGCFTCSWSTKRSKGSFSPAFSLGRIEMFALNLTHKPILGKRWKGSSTNIICSYI